MVAIFYFPGYTVQDSQEKRPIKETCIIKESRKENLMHKILFVCLGNICRSPMAEYVMKDLVKKAGCADAFEIASAATSDEEHGNPVYPPARRMLARHGIECAGHAARQITRRDFSYYDFIICMDESNLRNLKWMGGSDCPEKLHMLLDFTSHPGNVADPWYTGNFEVTWQDVLDGCTGLLHWLEQ